MNLSNFNLPDIAGSDLDSKQERKKILEYLYQLTEQLRFTLNNLDEENLSPDLADKVNSSERAAATATKELKDAQGNISRIRQTVDSLSLSVTNGASSSSISLNAGGTAISSANITLTGMVTFQNLATAGQTTINGYNITTGVIQSENFMWSSGNFSTAGTHINLLTGVIISPSLGLTNTGELYLKGKEIVVNNSLLLAGYGTSAAQVYAQNEDLLLRADGQIYLGSTSAPPLSISDTTLYLMQKQITGFTFGQGYCSSEWSYIGISLGSGASVTASDAGSTGYNIKTRYNGGWQWCVEGSSGSTTASYIAFA